MMATEHRDAEVIKAELADLRIRRLHIVVPSARAGITARIERLLGELFEAMSERDRHADTA